MRLMKRTKELLEQCDEHERTKDKRGAAMIRLTPAQKNWHEAYFMRGGMEAVYDDVPVRLGFGQFAPMQPARGPMFSARTRAKLAGEPPPAVVEEAELYGVASPQ
jgi:hypothetical protein